MKKLENLFVNVSAKDLLLSANPLTTQLIAGAPENVIEFEKKISEYFNVSNSVSVCSGTVAIFCALRAIGITNNDEVILNPASVIMSALPITQLGAKPVFVDTPDEPSFGICLNHLEKLINDKTKAIITVPMWGYPIEMEKLTEVCKKHGIIIIEDISQSHGTTWNNKLLGTYGEIGCLSTQERKLITTGEGGLVITNNDKIADSVRIFKRYGLNPDESGIGNFQGLNLKLSAFASALGLTQINKLESKIEARSNVGKQIREGISLNGWFKEIEYPIQSRQNYYALVFYITDENINPAHFGNYLSVNNIISDPWRYDYTPLYNYPIFPNSNRDCPNAEKLIKSVFTLPCHEGMTDEDIRYVIDTVNKYK